jgi:hypothetical protein
MPERWAWSSAARVGDRAAGKLRKTALGTRQKWLTVGECGVKWSAVEER